MTMLGYRVKFQKRVVMDIIIVFIGWHAFFEPEFSGFLRCLEKACGDNLGYIMMKL